MHFRIQKMIATSDFLTAPKCTKFVLELPQTSWLVTLYRILLPFGTAHFKRKFSNTGIMQSQRAMQI